MLPGLVANWIIKFLKVAALKYSPSPLPLTNLASWLEVALIFSYVIDSLQQSKAINRVLFLYKFAYIVKLPSNG